MKALSYFIISALTLAATVPVFSQQDILNTEKEHIYLQKITGKVLNRNDQRPVSGGKVKILDTKASTNKTLAETVILSTGRYEFKDITVPEHDGIKIMAYMNDEVEDWGNPLDGFVNFNNVRNGVLTMDIYTGKSPKVKNFGLHQNFPNPFNPATTITFNLPVSSAVYLKVYDLHGKEVANILDGKQHSAGLNEVVFNASELATGIYYYTIVAGEFSDIKKMSLIK